jgi:hypothetical protein
MVKGQSPQQLFYLWEPAMIFPEALDGEAAKIKSILLICLKITMTLAKQSFLTGGEWSLKVKTPTSRNSQFTVTQGLALMQKYAKISTKCAKNIKSCFFLSSATNSFTHKWA